MSALKPNENTSLKRQCARAAALNAAASAGVIGGMAAGVVIVGAIAEFFNKKQQSTPETIEVPES